MKVPLVGRIWPLITAFAKTLLASTDAAAARTVLGVSGGPAFDPASPGPIGGTTPAAITGTTLTATTSITIPDGTAYAIRGSTSTTTGIGIGTAAASWLSLYAGGSRLVDINTGGMQLNGIGLGAQGFITVGIAGVGGFLSNSIGTFLTNCITTVATTSTDGTENDLFSQTIPACLNANGNSISQTETLTLASSATATRRIRKYFAGSVVFDSGTLTPGVGAVTLSLRTDVFRESSTVVKVTVTCVATTAFLAPPVTYTRLTGLTLSGSNILKTTGVAAGTGAASADITDILQLTRWQPVGGSVA